MSQTDQKIVKRVVAGEKKAYADLVDRHKDRAMTLAFRILKDRGEAEEAVQDAFVRAFAALDSFEWRSSFSTWFYRIVFNVCSTALSKRKDVALVSLEHDMETAGLELEDHSPTPDIGTESAELRRIVREEIEQLPAAYSSVITLFFLQELSYEEIVEVTGMPLGTVKARLFRARQMLKHGINKRIGEPGPVGVHNVAAAFL